MSQNDYDQSLEELQQKENLTKKEQRQLRRMERQQEILKGRRKRGIKRILMWGGAVAAVIALIVGMAILISQGGSNTGTQAVAPIAEGDWVTGADDPLVVVTEYGDFQCPACAAYHPVVTALQDRFADDPVAFVYRHFPIERAHPNAKLAAQASEAAGEQGMFWEMHDLLFDRQDRWAQMHDPEDTFVGYADELGLDIEQFRAYMNSDAAEQAVEDDFDSGVSARVNATPTFFINGEFIANPPGYPQFEGEILNTLESLGYTTEDQNETDNESAGNAVE